MDYILHVSIFEDYSLHFCYVDTDFADIYVLCLRII